MCHSFVVSLGCSQVFIQFHDHHPNIPLISDILIIMVIIMIEYLQHKKLHKSIYLHFFSLHVPYSSLKHSMSMMRKCTIADYARHFFCCCCGNMTFMLTINVRNEMRNNFLFLCADKSVLW